MHINSPVTLYYYPPPPSQTGSTPLFRASFAGSIDEVKTLLEGGARVNEANDVSLILVDTDRIVLKYMIIFSGGSFHHLLL